MKILVVGSRIPWPLHDGGAIATYQLLKELSGQGADVVYFSFNTQKHFVNRATIDKQFSFCRVVDMPLNANPTLTGAIYALLTGKNYNISRFDDDKAKANLRELLSKETFDVVQLEGLYTAPFLEVVKSAGIPVVLRQHNAEFQIWERLASKNRNPLKRLYLKLLASQLRRYEIRVLNKVNAVLPITPVDQNLFHSLAPGKPMYLLPVGMNNQSKSKSEFNTNAFFHLGSMEWIPNVEAVKWLIDEVWPAVKLAIPSAELHIAGKGLQKNDPRFSGNGIHVHGEIDNAQRFMQSHGVMLVPVFAAGGIRVKMLEAFNDGIPVISTTVGVQGIPGNHEKELLLADSSHDFAAAMIRLRADPHLRESLTNHARLLIQKHYDTRTLISGLLTFYDKLKNQS